MTEPGDTATGPPRAQRLALALDFANTLLWHAREQPQETLHGYADLLGWAARRGAVDAARAQALADAAAHDAAAADAVLQRARALREAIYRAFVARIGGGSPAAADVALLNAELQRALPHYRLAFRGGAAAWLPADGDHDGALERPLWPIVLAAAELLLDATLGGRVGQCADPGGCGWLFLDLSKNRSRRWCSISDCGNRAKQRRLRARRSGSDAGAEG